MHRTQSQLADTNQENGQNPGVKIFAIIFLLVIIAWMGSSCISLINRKLSETSSSTSITWKAKEVYPFKEVTSTVVSSGIINKVSNVIEELEDRVEAWVTTANSSYNTVVLGKKSADKYLFGYNMTTSATGTTNNSDDVMDTIVLSRDGYLIRVAEDSNITSHIEKAITFGKNVKESGRNFLYFEPPFKSFSESPLYADVYMDYSDQKSAEVIAAFRDADLDVLSMTELIASQGLDKKSLFFKTDHHWLPQAALWASPYLASYLNNQFGYDINTEIFDSENYYIYDNDVPMLGSMGRNVTEIFAETEYLPVIIPRYDTSVEVKIPDKNIHVNGTVQETLYNWKLLQDKDLYSSYHYVAYGYGDNALVQIHNLNRHDGKRLLIIKTSFADVMAPYFPNMAEYVDLLDLRYFDGSLEKYIETENPDTIILFYGYSIFPNGANKSNESFDFR